MGVGSTSLSQEPQSLVWTNARYLALVESGIIEEGRGIELIGGQVITTMPQGRIHYLVCLALQRLLVEMGAMAQGLSIQPTIVVQEGEIYDPEFILLSPEYAGEDLPRASDALWVIEVSVSSRAIDLGPKKAAYAAAGIPDYWVFDAVKRGVWTFSDPVDGEYRRGIFVPVGEGVVMPVLGRTLETGRVFPDAGGSPAPQ